MIDSQFFRGKNVLVCGASGFVGTHLTSALLRHGANVRGSYLTRVPSQNTANLALVKSDFTRYEDCLEATKDMDYVFMAAANTSGASVIEKTPLAHLTPNVVMNAHMLAASYENNVKKFCFFSSNTVYPETDFAVTEDDVNYEFFHKYYIVGWMKLFSERMAEMYSRYINNPMQTLVVRPGNLYGPHDKFTWKESKVIAALIRKAVERVDPFPVWGDGNDVKDFLYIDDFISGVLMAFERDESLQVFNIASGTPVTIREVLDEILCVANHKAAKLEFDLSMPTMIPKRMINTDKIKALTGWVPKTSIENGLKLTVDWYKGAYVDSTPEDQNGNL